MEGSPSWFEKKTSLQRKDGEYKLPEITRDMNCPACGEAGLNLTRTLYSLPDGDDVFILVLDCNKCNYKKSDLIPVFTAFKPGDYILKVDDGDLTHKIFRGSTGDIIIEEIGVEIERGPSASFQFTNIEGVLRGIEKQLHFFIKSTPDDTPEWANAKLSLQKLDLCLSGKLPFTFILRDKDGGSYINPSNKEKLKFHPQEVK